MTTAPIEVSDNRVACKVPECKFKSHSLMDHVVVSHGISVEKYLEQFPGSPTVSKDFIDQMENGSLEDKRVRKAAPPATALSVSLMGVNLKVDVGVNPLDCLMLPDKYRPPTKGKAKGAFLRALMGLARGRNVYIWGLPGTGKDAFVHCYSALTRKPTVMVTFRPGYDISPWFYSRRIDEKGTGWEYGHLWNALVNGIKGKDGKTRAPLVLLSDVDRADEAQAEWFRILTDSISGRILGPDGRMQELITDDFGQRPQFSFTANSCGTGDERGRMTSASPIDASILDRLGRKIQAHYMDWEDEVEILRAKYPRLSEMYPEDTKNGLFDQLGRVTKSLRDAIDKQEIYAEFTHRGLCEILNECDDIVEYTPVGRKVPDNLLKRGMRAWLDGLESDAQFEARRLADPHMTGGALGDGD